MVCRNLSKRSVPESGFSDEHQAANRCSQETDEATLVKLQVTEEEVILGLEVSPKTPLDDLSPNIENALETIAGLTAALSPNISNILLLVRHPGEEAYTPPRIKPPARNDTSAKKETHSSTGQLSSRPKPSRSNHRDKPRPRMDLQQ